MQPRVRLGCLSDTGLSPLDVQSIRLGWLGGVGELRGERPWAGGRRVRWLLRHLERKPADGVSASGRGGERFWALCGQAAENVRHWEDGEEDGAAFRPCRSR